MKMVWCHMCPLLHRENTEMLCWKVQYLPTIRIVHMCLEKYPMTTGTPFQFKLTLVLFGWGWASLPKSVLVGRSLGI
jgi:hypothetical protein